MDGKVRVVEDMQKLERQILSFVEHVLGFKKDVHVYTTDSIEQHRTLKCVRIKNDAAALRVLQSLLTRRNQTIFTDVLDACNGQLYSLHTGNGDGQPEKRTICCNDCYDHWARLFRKFKQEILEKIVTLEFEDDKDVSHDFRWFN